MAEDILAKSGPSTGGNGSALPPLPSDALIIVPVRNTVLFPSLVLPIALGRAKSVAAAQQAVRDQRQVGILLQRAAIAAVRRTAFCEDFFSHDDHSLSAN